MELNFPYTLSFRVLPTKKVISEKGKKGKKDCECLWTIIAKEKTEHILLHTYF